MDSSAYPQTGLPHQEATGLPDPFPPPAHLGHGLQAASEEESAKNQVHCHEGEGRERRQEVLQQVYLPCSGQECQKVQVAASISRAEEVEIRERRASRTRGSSGNGCYG